MTLFWRAAPEEPRFAAMLQRLYDGEPDGATDATLGETKPAASDEPAEA